MFQTPLNDPTLNQKQNMNKAECDHLPILSDKDNIFDVVPHQREPEFDASNAIQTGWDRGHERLGL